MKAMRAISALFLKRLLQPVLLIIVILLVAGYLFTALLALTFSAWWWLLLLIFIPLSLFFGMIVYVLWFLLQQLLPRKLSSAEQKQLHAFTDNLFHIAERTRTPYPVLLFLIAKDVIRGKESSFLRDLIGDSRRITKDFEAIQALFRS